MSCAIIDNATLTAVQRLLGEIPIYNKHAIDGDILAFETLIQAILFYDDVCYLNDYKDEHKDKRNQYFNYLCEIDIDGNSYDALKNKTNQLASDIIPRIEGGFFTDSDFRPFFDLLKMHNIFTWDMSSSIYYLTQKMLIDSKNELDIEKYSKLNQMILSELQDSFARTPENKSVISDSSGRPITSKYSIRDKEGKAQEAYIGKQTKLLMANLSWLAYRTIFYTLATKEMGGNLILHPIRNAFQINFLAKLFPECNRVFNSLISAMNSATEATITSVFNSTQPLVSKYPLPMFSVLLVQQAGSPQEAINAAYHMKCEGDFIEARKILSEIDCLFSLGKNSKAVREANRLVFRVRTLMEQICAKYYVATPQGISLSPVITAYNLSAIFSPGVLPPLPNCSAKIRVLGKIKDWIPQRGFNAVYKSLVNDLTQISKLGEYHDKLTSQVMYHENAAFYTSKTEDSQYIKAKSYWKIPM